MDRELFTPPEPQEKEQNKRSFPRLLIRVICVAAVVIFAVCINHIRSNRVQRSWTEREEDIRIEAAVIPEEIFLGRAQVLGGSSTLTAASQGEVMTQTVDGTSLELIYFPFSIEVRPEMPGIMSLEFQDADGGEVYRFVAAYALSEGILTLSAPEEADNARAEAETGQSAPLTDGLTYYVSLADGEIGLIHEAAAELYLNQGVFDSSVILQGTACSDADMYEGIASLDLRVTEAGAETPCQLFFADGGYSTDAAGRYTGVYHVEIWMEHEMIPSDGGMRENVRSQTYMLAFYNNYPYGFTVRDGNNYYFYHDPVMTVD